MSHVRFWPTALLAVVLVASLRAGEGKGSDEEPTLLGLIRKRLEKVPELQRTKGVQIEKAAYSRGVIRITGSVKTYQQRDRVLREVEAMRRDIESTLDIKIKEIDVSGLAGPARPGSEKEKAQPGRLPAPLPGTQQQAKPDLDGGHVVWSVVVWDSAWGYAPPAVWYPPPCYSCGPFPAYSPAPGWGDPFHYYPW
jgi:hypothetical protein